MAITSTQTDGVERIQMATGAWKDTATTPDAAAITVGFLPRLIVIENETDRIKFEWRQGMTSTYCVKEAAAGTRTLETSGGVTIATSNKGFSFAVIQNKQYRWQANS